MIGHVLLHPHANISLFIAVASLSAAPLGIAHADKVMRVGITASDIQKYRAPNDHCSGRDQRSWENNYFLAPRTSHDSRGPGNPPTLGVVSAAGMMQRAGCGIQKPRGLTAGSAFCSVQRPG